jgi:chromosome segregation protein
LEQSQARLQELNSDFVSVRTKKEQLAELLYSNANKRVDILARIESIQESLEEIQPQLVKENALFEDLNEQLEELTEDLETVLKILSEKSQLFNQENITYIQQLNRVTSAEQEIEFKQTAFESSKDRIEKYQEELSQLDGEIKTLLESHEVKDEELIELYSEKEGIELGVTEAEKSYYGERGAIDELDTRIRSLQKAKEAYDELVLALQNQINEVRLKMAGMKERLNVEFDIEICQRV